MILDRTVMWLTWRQLFAKRRWLLAIIFTLVPLLISLVFRLNVGEHDGVGFLRGLNKDIVVGTLLPLAALVFGTTAFGGDVDDGTLVFLLVKPIARWRVVLSKYVIAVVSTVAVVSPAILLPWLLLRTADTPPALVWSFLSASAIGAAIYGALFVAMGIATKRALVLGLFYVIVFENVVTRTLEGVRSASVREFVLTLAQHLSGGALELNAIVTIDTVRTMGPVLLIGATLFSIWRLNRYEIAEQP